MPILRWSTLLSLVIGVVITARLEKIYLPPDSAISAGGGNSNFLKAPPLYNNNNENNKLSQTPIPNILRFNNANNGDGNYQFDFETENGISQQESGGPEKVEGSYSYVGSDGITYTVRYTADENGFRPVADHLPTVGPLPAAIQKALEQNAQDEANGVYDDGQYRPTADNGPEPPNRHYLGPPQNIGYRY